MRWALVPNYYKGKLSDFKPILNNCRSETIEDKPSFKRPLKTGQRCVILAEGYDEYCGGGGGGESVKISFRFFEWKKNTLKTPYFIYQHEPMVNEKHYPDIDVDQMLINLPQDQLPFLAMAGLFDINEHCQVLNNLQKEKIDPLYSCAICTVDASETMQTVHIRMPVKLFYRSPIFPSIVFFSGDSHQSERDRSMARFRSI